MRRISVQAERRSMSARKSAALTAGRTDIGGVGSFLGTVRDAAGGRRITGMRLEHYPGMTERAMTDIADRGVRALAAAGLHADPP